MPLVRKLGHGGGLFNILDANAKWPVPSVGDGATILYYTDRRAGTVIEVKQERSQLIVAVQTDKVTRTDKLGMSDCQSYSYERDPKGGVAFFRRAKDGRWVHVVQNPDTGRWKKAGSSTGVKFGIRDEYFDFSF